jgi:hypothetical protein
VADHAADCREAVLLGGRVELGPHRAAATARAARGGVDGHGVHQAQVDHEPAVAAAVPRVVVAAAAHRNLEVVLLGERDRGGDLLTRRTPRDRGRPAVDLAVPQRSSVVVARVRGQQHLAAETILQGPELLIRRDRHPDLRESSSDRENRTRQTAV